ncbi:MAG: hypothetical protein U1F41_01620 [Burkholderiales bacterium]
MQKTLSPSRKWEMAASMGNSSPRCGRPGGCASAMRRDDAAPLPNAVTWAAWLARKRSGTKVVNGALSADSREVPNIASAALLKRTTR